MISALEWGKSAQNPEMFVKLIGQKLLGFCTLIMRPSVYGALYFYNLKYVIYNN